MLEQHLLIHRAIVHWEATRIAVIIAEQFQNYAIMNVPGYVCNPGSPRERDAASKR